MWSNGSLFSFKKFGISLWQLKTSRAKFMFICDIHTAFCKDQQFGKHHMRIKKIHFDFVVE